MIVFLLLLSTVSKDVLTNIMHISDTVLITDTDCVFYVRRSVYRSTSLHGSKDDDDDNNDANSSL